MLPTFHGKNYRLILVMPASGHRDGEDSATFFLLCIEGGGVWYGTVYDMRKFKRHARHAVGRRRLVIERQHARADQGNSSISIRQLVVWDLLEHLEALEIYKPA